MSTSESSSPKLYRFQEQAVDDLRDGKHICILPTGAGKTAVMFRWLSMQQKHDVVIVTTATKAKSGDMEKEADLWNGAGWRASLDSFTVISWHGLKKWCMEHGPERALGFRDYAFAFDEVQKSKGYSTGMGKFFQKITAATDCWTGYTATPGDKWIDIMPYFVATGKERNKTAWMHEYAVVATYKGYPEIVNYLHEDKLEHIWRDEIATIPDAEQMFRELPPETHKVIHFKAPSDYKNVIRTRLDRDGELIETTMGLCHYLRQICFTKEKQEWLADFIENLGTNCVFFCNYIEEEEKLCELAEKALPKGARIWRIDGKHHEIPTADTIGKYDIVVAHYASGGEALNLQFMNYWVSVSPNYSFSSSVQARGRIKRIGQKKPMFFYYLKADKTIEEAIYETLANKHDFSEKTWLADNGIEDV
jgi:hypothetical protein